MSDDLISRKQALHAVEWDTEAYTAINMLPSVDEVKHGRWISCSSSEHYKCSCCGTRASFWFDEENSSGWQMDMSEWLSDYCPNCGADMRERKES